MTTRIIGKTPKQKSLDLNGLSAPDPEVFLVCVSEPNDVLTEKPRSPQQLKLRRRRQYALGRAAAYKTLRNFGFKNPPLVPRGQGGMPVWPDGVVGSITHTQAAAVAAIASTSRFRALGIDLQEIREIRADFCERIGNAEEAAWCKSVPELQPTRTLSLFSGKESIYKALYPFVREYFGFSAAELVWNDVEKRFDGRLLTTLSDEFQAGFSFSVVVQYLPESVFTAFVLKR